MPVALPASSVAVVSAFRALATALSAVCSARVARGQRLGSMVLRSGLHHLLADRAGFSDDQVLGQVLGLVGGLEVGKLHPGAIQSGLRLFEDLFGLGRLAGGRMRRGCGARQPLLTCGE